MGVLIRTSGMPEGPRRKIYAGHEAGHLNRLAPGVFAPREVIESLPPWDAYQLRCAAVGYFYTKYTLVGKSAAAIWEIPYGNVPDRVEIARIQGHGGLRSQQVKVRSLANLPGQELQSHREVCVTSPLQTVLNLCRWENLADAVTASDHCLREGLFTLQELEVIIAQLKALRGVSKLKNLLLLAHGASESPRESALRVAMWENGFPVPDLQAVITNSRGQFLGRVDMLFAEESVLVEYDGGAKYASAFGQSTEEVLMNERRREKDLLNLGTRMVRVTAETFADGRWIQDLRRELELGRGRGLDRKLWSSQGLGWGSPTDKKPRGLAYGVGNNKP